MPKFEVDIEDQHLYRIIVEAQSVDEAEEIAWSAVGDDGIDPADGHCEVLTTIPIADDTPGPFPRSDD